MPNLRFGDLRLLAGPIVSTSDGNTAISNMTTNSLWHVLYRGNTTAIAWTGNVTYIGGGYYMLGGNATTIPVGEITLIANQPTFALPWTLDYQVLPTAAYDPLYSGNAAMPSKLAAGNSHLGSDLTLTTGIVANITGNITGAIVGNHTGNTVGTQTGNIIGNLTGNQTSATTSLGALSLTSETNAGALTASGGFVGNITGNQVGTFTGNITGNQTGTNTGNVTANYTIGTWTTTGNASSDGSHLLTVGNITAIQSGLSTFVAATDKVFLGNGAHGGVGASVNWGTGQTGNITGNQVGTQTGAFVGNWTGNGTSTTTALGALTLSSETNSGNASVGNLTATGSIISDGAHVATVGNLPANLTLLPISAAGNLSQVKLSSDGLDTISTTAPSGVASNFREMLVQVWRRFFKRHLTLKSDATHGNLTTYADNGTSVLTTQAYTTDGSGNDTMGAAS